MFIVRRLVITLLAIALSLQGVAAAVLMPMSIAKVTMTSEHATDTRLPCHDADVGVNASAESDDPSVTQEPNHHTDHSRCAGALCCAALISQAPLSFEFFSPRYIIAPRAERRVVATDPAPFDRPPRT